MSWDTHIILIATLTHICTHTLTYQKKYTIGANWCCILECEREPCLAAWGTPFELDLVCVCTRAHKQACQADILNHSTSMWQQNVAWKTTPLLHAHTPRAPGANQWPVCVLMRVWLCVYVDAKVKRGSLPEQWKQLRSTVCTWTDQRIKS